jgi:CO/xanthine dehydrogenase Mo-binding subunit
MPDYQHITHSPIKKDAREKVTGAALYTADLPLENCAHGAVLRSPHHHARITRIDTTEAEQFPGVIKILTAADIPGEPIFGAIIPDRPVLASEVVRYQGEPLAVVIAEQKSQALDALQKITVEYRVLGAVFEASQALEDQAPRVHPDGNLLLEYNHGRGNIEEGFAASEIVLEETFRLPRIYPGYLEPEASTAVWQEEEETLVVWVSSQKPFEDRRAVSAVLALDTEQVHVRSAEIGGAFGGKEDSGLPILAALAAYAVRGSVKLINSREESITGHPKRHPAEVHYKLGARRDGTLMALEVKGLLDTGAYASYGPAIGGVFTEIAPGAYRTPHIQVSTKIVYTNSPFSGAMRGFGAPQAIFAVENMVNKLADALEIDPIELRRKNLWRKGERTPSGVLLEQEPSLNACLDEVDKALQDLRALPTPEGKLSGVGFSLLVQAMGLGKGLPDDTTTRITWLPNGEVSLDIGTPDMGQGTLTVGAQIAAEELGLPYESIRLDKLDTSISPDGGVTCASRMTYMVGNATIRTAAAAVRALLDQAASELDLPRDRLTYRAGKIHIEGGKTRPIPAAEICARAAEQDLQITGEETYSFPYPPEITPDDMPIGMPHIRFGYGAHAARVEIDPALGTVQVTDLVAVHDVGKALNPRGVEGQIEGGAAMGVGYALLEEVKLKSSGRWTDNLTEYLMPTTLDTPRIRSVIIEHPEPTGPYGARGMAEMSMSPVAPAVTHAIADSVGVYFNTIPISGEMITEKTAAAQQA